MVSHYGDNLMAENNEFLIRYWRLVRLVRRPCHERALTDLRWVELDRADLLELRLDGSADDFRVPSVHGRVVPSRNRLRHCWQNDCAGQDEKNPVLTGLPANHVSQRSVFGVRYLVPLWISLN